MDTIRGGKPIRETARSGAVAENIARVQSKIPHIKSPWLKIHELPNFELKAIWAKFRIANFERIASEYHTDMIRGVIVDNKFYDPFIRGYKAKDGVFVVVDGQHRLASLWVLHKYYGLKQYSLHFIEYNEKDARQIYRGLNAGKALTLKNVLKSYDEGRHKFFNDLGDILSHDDGTREWSFAEALGCLAWVKGGTKNLGRLYIDKVLDSVTDWDIKFIREFVKGLKLTMPSKSRGTQHRPPFIKPCFAIAYTYNLHFLKISNLIYYGLGLADIEARLDTASKAGFVQLQAMFDEGVKPEDKKPSSY